jgi:isochorismate synthase
MTSSIQKWQLQFEKKMPFVLYRKPNSSQLISVLQENDELYFVENYQENGFVLAPFDGDEIVLIPENRSQVEVTFIEKISAREVAFQNNENEDTTAKNVHINLVQKGIDAIEKGDFNKVVLSRKETVLLTQFDLFEVFQKLLNWYPTAFAYCFYHPKVGLWLGAFSEQLLRVKQQNFRTMAVAGTQLYEENSVVVWEEKEIVEQQMVTDFIVSKIGNLTSDLTISKPYTLKAGHLAHIKTDIQGVFKESIHLKDVLPILHPTPAVCGFPKEKAKDFILKSEGYKREYYSGFLGELNCNFESKEVETDLYVNLRCMQIVFDEQSNKSSAIIYIGGGITKDSKPEKEWLETVNKSKTIKKVLH